MPDVVENLIKWPHSHIPEPHPFYKKLAKVPGEFAIIDLDPRLTALLAQTIHGKKITYAFFQYVKSIPTIKRIAKTPSRPPMIEPKILPYGPIVGK